MFFKIIFSYILGYLNISIEGYYIERFINICKGQNITIWNLKSKKSTILYFNVKINDFKKICKVAKKTKCKIKINDKKGLPFLMYKYKKRKMFLMFLILVIFFIWLSSLFVWNVDIIEENNQEIANIMQDVEEAGIRTGMLKNKINTKEVINKIRLKRNDIAWVGIEKKGTNIIIKIVKADEKPQIVDEDEYCNITASKAGIITKINAQNGTANVKVGDSVNKGDILINGWMEGKYTGIRYVHAKGEIEAKIEYQKSKKILYNVTKKRETGRAQNKYSLKINNFKINFSKKCSKFKIYDTIETNNKFRIFSDFYLPISIVKTTYQEMEEYTEKNTFEEAKKQGIEELEKELNNQIDNKEKIVNKNVTTYEENDGVEVFVTYEVLENIGTNEKIVF